MSQLFKAGGGLSKGIQPDLVKKYTKSGHTGATSQLLHVVKFQPVLFTYAKAGLRSHMQIYL